MAGGRAAPCRPPAGPPAPLLARGIGKRFGGLPPSTGSTSTCARVPSSASSVRTAPARQRCSTRPPGCSPSMPGAIAVAGSPAGSRTARAASVLVPDEPTGFDELSVMELVSLVHALWGAAAGNRAGGGARDGVRSRRPARPEARTLSRGLRRQASAVAALSLAPPLMLIDEATATLDPEAIVVLCEAVARLRRGMRRPARYPGSALRRTACHEIVLLHRGVVIDRGEPGALRRGTAPRPSRRSSSPRSATGRFAKGSEMRSTLCEAVARCHLRRLRGIAASAPLPAAVMALVIAAAPFVLFRLGGALGAEVAESIDAAGVSGGPRPRTAARGRCRGRDAGGRAPARSTLGNQIAAGPAGAVVAVIALVLVPVVAGSVIVVPSLVAVCVGLAGALSVGAAAGFALAAATLAGIPAGAVVAEGALRAGRGRPRRAGCVGRGAELACRGARSRSVPARAARARVGSASRCRVTLARSRGCGLRRDRARRRLGGTCRHPRRAAVTTAVGRPLPPTPPAAACCCSRAARPEG